MAENANISKFAAVRKNSLRFFKDVRAELKKVIWPTREQLTNYTVTVLGACLVVGIVLWLADLGFSQLAAITFK